MISVALLVALFYLTDRYMSVFTHISLLEIGVYHNNPGIISQEELDAAMEETVRKFVRKLGSPKLRTFYQFERHRESYDKLFRTSVHARHKVILNNIEAHCDANTKSDNICSYEDNNREVLRTLCPSGPVLFVPYILSQIVHHHQQQTLTANKSATPSQILNQLLQQQNLSLQTPQGFILETCNLCGEKFVGVITTETAQEDLTYLADAGLCEARPDIIEQLTAPAEEERIFWSSVSGKDITELVTTILPVTQYTKQYFQLLNIDYGK